MKSYSLLMKSWRRPGTAILQRELQTTNELQSTNEELETMNEELQSANEELQTINEEVRLRSQEIKSINAF